MSGKILGHYVNIKKDNKQNRKGMEKSPLKLKVKV